MKRVPTKGQAGKSSFLQARRLEMLRELLERNARGLTLEELSHSLHITERSVRRYLHQLESSVELESVPLTPGGAHVWRFKPSERPRTLPLRRSQAYALLAARRVFEPLVGSALHDELELTFGELEKLATRPGRTAQHGELSSEANLEGRFFAVAERGPRLTVRGEELDTLFSAVANRQVLQVRDGESERFPIEPYAMVLERGHVVMIGKDLRSRTVRAWSFEQLQELHMTDAHYELPADFDVEPYYRGAFGFEDPSSRIRVVIEFYDEAAKLARRLRLHPEQTVQHTRDGKRARIAFMVTDLERVKRWVLGFGAEARVVEPLSLAESVRAEIAKMAALYPQ